VLSAGLANMLKELSYSSLNILKRGKIFLAFVLLSACGGGGGGGGGSSDPDPAAIATYTVTFSTEWSGVTFPTNYPGDRDRHFSSLVGATHNEQVIFWESGQLASEGIEKVAEDGDNSVLESEIDSAIDTGTADAVLMGDGIPDTATETELMFLVSKNYPLVSLVSMLAPSPDWFVGVSGVSLMQGGDWIDEFAIDLVAYDAGTDSGVVYYAANNDTDPQNVILPLDSLATDTDFADGVHRDDGRHVATFRFKREP